MYPVCVSVPRCAVFAAFVLISIAVAIPAAAAPGAFQLTGTAVCTSNAPAVSLQWTPSRGATSYDVIRDDGQHPFVLNGYAYDTNVVTGGPAHTYFVRASDGGPVTTDSNSVSVAPFPTPCSPAPVPFTITGFAYCDPGDPQHSMSPAVQVEWHSVLYAASFDLYFNGVFFSTLASHGSSLFTYVGRGDWLAGQTITFYVVARNPVGTSTSNTIELTVAADICSAAPPVPVLSGSAVCDNNAHVPAVQLDWTDVPGASGYQLFRNGVPYVIPGNFGYTDKNVVPGQTYTYNVATTGLAAPLSNTVTVTVSDDACPPLGFTASAFAICPHAAPAVRLTWSPSVHATSYTVSRDGNVVSGTLPATAGEYIDESATQGFHAYSVLSSNASGRQMASTNVSISRADCGLAPGAFIASATGDCNHGAPAVIISWSLADGATSYLVVRDGVTITGSGSLAYVDTNVVANQSYTYTILASNAYGNASAAVGPITPSLGYCPPTTFTLNVATGCDPPVALDWTAATNNVLNYSIFREQQMIASVGSNMLTYADYGAQANTSYEYFVRATGSGGSSDSNVVIAHVDQACEGPFPDLTALAIKPSAMSGRVGDTIAVNVELANLGNGTATAATARLRLGRGPVMSAADLVLGTIPLPVMGSGEDITRTINVKLPPVATGTYYLFLSLDEEHLSGEVHFDDDVKASDAFSLTDMIPPKRRAATH